MPAPRDRDRIALLVALVGPFLVCLALVPFRDSIANTNAALLLVLVIVGVAASGTRTAGALAAISAALWFDFFLTQPYGRLTITERSDLETTALLLAVGVGVAEIAVWGRRQRAIADRREGYLDGIRVAAETVASGGSSRDLVDEVSRQLVLVLGLRSCRFEYGVAGLGNPARLRHDGRVEWRHEDWDVEGKGLPVESEIELLVESGRVLKGRFMLGANPDSYPSLAQRKVAVTLADQVGASVG